MATWFARFSQKPYVTRMTAKQIQAFTLRFNGRADRIITDLRVSDAFDPQLPPEKYPPLIGLRVLLEQLFHSIAAPSIVEVCQRLAIQGGKTPISGRCRAIRGA